MSNKLNYARNSVVSVVAAHPIYDYVRLWLILCDEFVHSAYALVLFRAHNMFIHYFWNIFKELVECRKP